MQNLEVVVSGLGAISAQAKGLVQHREKLMSGGPQSNGEGQTSFALNNYDVRREVPDRKMLKAISQADAYSLIAIDDLRNMAALNVPAEDPWRRGLYVGAQNATAEDNSYYFDAMKAAGNSVSKFGSACMDAKPVALLIGLPNNVLCYGSMLIDAKGPNSNYTAAEVSGHHALVAAARRLRWGKLDLAVAGGFSAHASGVDAKVLNALGVAKSDTNEKGNSMRVADGAVFCLVESRSSAIAAGRKPLVTLVEQGFSFVGRPPVGIQGELTSFSEAISAALQRAKVSLDEIGLVLAGASGVTEADACELLVLSRVFAKARVKPALGLFSRRFGNLMEASGLLELGLLEALYDHGGVPHHLQPADEHLFSQEIDAKRPYVLVTKVSLSGQCSCLVVKREMTY